MNIIWPVLFIASLIILIFRDAATAFSVMLSGSEKALALTIKLLAIYAVWLGLLKIVEDTKLDQKIQRLLSPALSFLFGKVDKDTQNFLSLNLTSNLLGMGNASTPSGIEAMKRMDSGRGRATKGMIMLLILNTTNLQILPTTIISLRFLHSSQHSTSIILPTILTSLVCVTVAILLTKICGAIFGKEKSSEKMQSKNTFDKAMQQEDKKTKTMH